MHEPFFAIGCGIARMSLARPEYQLSTWPAVAVVGAYADHEIGWAELLTALAIWEHTGGPHATN